MVALVITPTMLNTVSGRRSQNATTSLERAWVRRSAGMPRRRIHAVHPEAMTLFITNRPMTPRMVVLTSPSALRS